MARRTVEQAGGFDAAAMPTSRRSRPITATTTCRWSPGIAAGTARRCSRIAGVVELEATSADRSVLDAVDTRWRHAHLTRDYIPDHVPARDDDGLLADAGGKPVMRELDLSFASEQWQRVDPRPQHPGRCTAAIFEACVLTYLAAELRTGDVAVRGSQAYANWAGQLLARADCEALLRRFCAEAGLPDQRGRRSPTQLQARLDRRRPRTFDAGYPDNTDLVIDERPGTAALKRRRPRRTAATARLPWREALKRADARTHAAGDPRAHRATG